MSRIPTTAYTVSKCCAVCGHIAPQHFPEGPCLRDGCDCSLFIEHQTPSPKLAGAHAPAAGGGEPQFDEKKPEPPGDLWERMEKIDREYTKAGAPGFTVNEYAAKRGISSDAAAGRLARLVAQGKLSKGTAFRNSRRVYVYNPIED